MALLTQILRGVFTPHLGLDAGNNLVLGGKKIFYNHNTGTDGVVDLSTLSGGGGIGGAIAFAPAVGVIDPNIAGFVAGVGPAGTGRLKVTLAGNTSFEGLPAGADGQQLIIVIVAGNFLLSLLDSNGGTLQKQILAPGGGVDIGLKDSISLVYDAGLTQWIATP